MKKRIHPAIEVAVLALVSTSCINIAGGCGNELLNEVASPNGRMKAVVFQRDCGASTGFSTQVSVFRREQELPNEGGNLFAADTNHGDAPSGKGGGPVVEVTWIDDNELVIKHDKRARLFQHSQSLGNVKVRYETFSSLNAPNNSGVTP